MKLFTVTLETTLIVVADDEREAEELALEADISISEMGAMANDMRHYPGDWDENSIPYGEQDPQNPDKTVQEWIDEGAAPLYKINVRK